MYRWPQEKSGNVRTVQLEKLCRVAYYSTQDPIWAGEAIELYPKLGFAVGFNDIEVSCLCLDIAQMETKRWLFRP